MHKVKFNTYNDGVLFFGKYIESYDINGNATDEKEFIDKGKLFFSYQSIREEDKLKFQDTGKKISMKIKTPYMIAITSSDTVKLDNELYSILHIDKDSKRQSLFIYLTELENELDKHVEILKEYRKSALDNKVIEPVKTVWGKVIDVKDNTNIKDISQRVKHKKVITIRYLGILDININKKVTVDYKIKYKEIIYNINSIINTNDDDELLELTIERSY